ncbi:MAG: hypothetical protein QXP79_01465 [Thermoplasmata archaeon]
MLCPSCHSVFDKDIDDANKIKEDWFYLRNLGETLAEDYASTSSMLEYIRRIPHVKASIAVEARSPKVTDEAKTPSVRAG